MTLANLNFKIRLLVLLCGSFGCIGQIFCQPDFYGEEYKKSLAFYANVGQKMNSMNQVADDIVFSSMNSMPELCIRKESTLSIWWTDFAPTPDNTPMIASVNRIDIRPSGELSSDVVPIAQDIASDRINVYNENNPNGFLQIPGYQKVKYTEVYKDIDMIIYSGAVGAKLSFVCNPGSNPDNINIRIAGHDSLKLDLDGALKVYLNHKWVELKQAVAYQYDQNNNIIQVQWTANYMTTPGSANVGLHFDSYDTSLPLVFLIGQAMGGGGNTSGLLWSTNHSGNGTDEFYAVDHDPQGNIYVGGYSYTGEFPVTMGTSTNPGGYTGTLVKFNADHERMWATYYGGSQADEVKSLAYSSSNQMLYATGYTLSSDFPIQAASGSFNYPNGSSYILRLNSTTGIATWATRLGNGRGYSIACSTNGDKYLVGYGPIEALPSVEQSGSYYQSYGGGDFDGTIFKFNAEDQLVWSTYLGGSGDDEYLEDVCIDDAGRVYVLGMSSSTNFPTHNPGDNAYFQEEYAGGGTDLVLAKFSPDGILEYSSYYGGSSTDISPDHDCIQVGDGRLYFVARTTSVNFPTLSYTGAMNDDIAAGGDDGVIVVMDAATMKLEYATYFGGAGSDGCMVSHWIHTEMHMWLEQHRAVFLFPAEQICTMTIAITGAEIIRGNRVTASFSGWMQALWR